MLPYTVVGVITNNNQQQSTTSNNKHQKQAQPASMILIHDSATVFSTHQYPSHKTWPRNNGNLRDINTTLPFIPLLVLSPTTSTNNKHQQQAPTTSTNNKYQQQAQPASMILIHDSATVFPTHQYPSHKTWPRNNGNLRDINTTLLLQDFYADNSISA